MNRKVDALLRKKEWQQELKELRRIILESELTEDVKWRTPCYTFQNHNVVLIGKFKEFCVLSFFKGALLKDSKKILVKPGENSQSARIIRFTDLKEIKKLESTLKSYIREAIAVEKAGQKVKLKKITEHAIPEELQKKFKTDPAFKAAFRALTPGRQRGYLIHFSGAKQSATRVARIEKSAKQIFAGKGMHD